MGFFSSLKCYIGILRKKEKRQERRKEDGRREEKKKVKERKEEKCNKIKGQKNRKAGRQEKRIFEHNLFQRNILESTKELLVKLKLREADLIVYDFDLCVL